MPWDSTDNPFVRPAPPVTCRHLTLSWLKLHNQRASILVAGFMPRAPHGHMWPLAAVCDTDNSIRLSWHWPEPLSLVSSPGYLSLTSPNLARSTKKWLQWYMGDNCQYCWRNPSDIWDTGGGIKMTPRLWSKWQYQLRCPPWTYRPDYDLQSQILLLKLGFLFFLLLTLLYHLH